MTLWSAWACRIDGRGLLSGVADGEGQHELGEAPEERQEAHPEQDQVGPLGQAYTRSEPDTQNASSTSRIPVTSWSHQ